MILPVAGLCTAIWDAATGNDTAALRRLLPHPKADLAQQARDFLARRVEEEMAGARFELIASPDGNRQFVLRHRPVRLIDAIWQRFAEEISGAFACARCRAPKCGCWLLRNGDRSDCLQGQMLRETPERAWSWAGVSRFARRQRLRLFVAATDRCDSAFRYSLSKTGYSRS